MRRTASKVFDVIYLNKRKHFLEEVISIILQPHQLKGFYLLYSIAPELDDHKINMYRFSYILVGYLNNYLKVHGPESFKKLR